MPAASAPDFAVVVPGEGFRLYRAYGGGGYVVVPDMLDVSPGREARPGLRLEMIRGELPSQPPEPHGRLQIEFQPAFPRAKALRRARQHDARATIRPASLSQARVRFRVGREVSEWPKHLAGVHDLVDDGRGRCVLDVRLTLDDATAVRRFLEADRLSVDAVLDADVHGVPPRADLSVTFDPGELIGVLRDSSMTRYDDLTSIFEDALPGNENVPITLSERPARGRDYAEAVVARLYREYGRRASAGDDDRTRVAWADAVPSGRVTWDLSEAIVTPRPVTLTVDPFEAARQVVDRRGIDAVSPTVVVPALQSGQHRVSVIANLPAHRPAVVEAGVELEAPARPPFRLQTQHRAVVLTPPDDRGEADFRFSPLEDPVVQVQPYVMLRESGGIRRYETDAWSTGVDRLKLRPSDFPGTFLPLKAGTSLLRIATLHVAVRYRQAGVAAEAEIRLTHDAPEAAVALPPETELHDLVVRARPREEGAGEPAATARELRVEGVPVDVGSIDLTLFPEYGPHTIRIECPVESGDLFALDIRPEGSPEHTSVLHFTEGRPSREWSWTAESPFRAGYEYRPHDVPDGIGWTRVASPFQDLVLQPHA